MKAIQCPKCGSAEAKKNGTTRHEQQRYLCKICAYQYSEYPQNKQINDRELTIINNLLLERISLRGICRAVNVSMPWLLDHIEQLYAQLPDDLNILSDDVIQSLPTEEPLDRLIIAFMQKKRAMD